MVTSLSLSDTIDTAAPEQADGEMTSVEPVVTNRADYIRLTAAASVLGMSRQRVFRMYRNGAFKSAHRRGPMGSPIYVLRSEVVELANWYRSTIPITEAADLIGVERTSVYRWLRSGKAGGGRDASGEWRILIEDVNRYRANAIVESPSPSPGA